MTQEQLEGFREVHEAFEKFSVAQQQAEAEGMAQFNCPLCGGTAWWHRAEWNKHLHMGCGKCGFRSAE